MEAKGVPSFSPLWNSGCAVFKIFIGFEKAIDAQLYL